MSDKEFLSPESEIGKIFGDIFGGNIFGPGRRGSTRTAERAPPKREPKIEIDYLPCYDPDTVQQILAMYAEGVAIADIEAYFGCDVNQILDHYAPFMQ